MKASVFAFTLTRDLADQVIREALRRPYFGSST